MKKKLAKFPNSVLARLDDRLGLRAFGHYKRLMRVQVYVIDHLDEPISLHAAAGIAGLERTYFSRFFHSATGIRFREWVNLLRIRQALRVLSSSNNSITAVAFEVGFGDLRTFERCFKRNVGMTAREFKRRTRPGGERVSRSYVKN